MARMYRECEALLNYALFTPAQRIATVRPIDADQVPSGYLKSAKISVVPNYRDDAQTSFLLVASTNSNPTQADDWITAGAVPNGGGTVWLNLKRPVKASAEETDRADGEVFLHLMCQGPNLITQLDVYLAVEVWGRFVNLVLN